MKAKKKLVISRVLYWWEKLQRIYGTNLGDAPNVTFSGRMTSTAGLAIMGRGSRKDSLYRKEVRFSLHFMDQESMLDFDQTIAHEVCHIFVDLLYKKRCKHGNEWRIAMTRLGLPPNRCHQYRSAKQKISKPRIDVCCAKCKKRLSVGPTQSKRIKGGKVYKCRNCGTQIMSSQLQ